jgi:hypothetical protein
MGFEIDYKLNGHKVTQQQWIKGMADEAVKKGLVEIEKEVHRKVASLRCPTHQQTPTIRTRIVGHELRSEIRACCDPMRDRAQMIATRRA